MSELLPCPFCGKAAGPATKKATRLPLSPKKVSCSDSMCGAHYGHWHPDEWNSRAQPAQQEEVEAQETIVSELVGMLAQVVDELDCLNCTMRSTIDGDMPEPEEETELCDETDDLIDKARQLMTEALDAQGENHG